MIEHKLRKYCVYAVGENDLYVFDSISDALEFIKREYVDKLYLKIGERP